jgi:putative DNA primase/helicase
MRTWADTGITLPYGAIGEVRVRCPQCSASRRKSRESCLTVNIDKGAWVCWHCGWKGGLRGPLQSSARPPLPRPPMPPDVRKRAGLRRIWGEASPLTADDPVLAYMRRRGIPLSLGDLPHVIRYHPRLLYKHDNGQRTYHPGMVARVDDPNGQGVSLHRTYLTADGKKAPVSTPKKLMSPAIPGATRGGAIRLYSAAATMAVCEGIETAIAVHLATHLPVWATICAGGMARLIVPAEVSLVVICADHDAAGLGAARALARRLLGEQRRVKILTPKTPGTDWADDLQEMVHG